MRQPGRPRRNVDTIEILRLRLAGASWPQIARRLDLGQGTAYRAYRQAMMALQPFQNPKAGPLRQEQQPQQTTPILFLPKTALKPLIVRPMAADEPAPPRRAAAVLRRIRMARQWR